MNNSKLIYLYRHGETNLNVSGITMGQLTSLHTTFTDKGYNQISDLNQKLKENSIEVIYSSDYERTLNTAIIANKDINLPLFSTKELHGLNMGNYQGKPMEEFLNSEEAKICFQDHNVKFCNGESINELNNRIINFIINICQNTNYQKIALITHSAVISNLRAHLAKDSYHSVNECLIAYENGQLQLLSSSKKEKILSKKRC